MMDGALIAVVVGFVLAFVLGGPKRSRVQPPQSSPPPSSHSQAPTQAPTPGPAGQLGAAMTVVASAPGTGAEGAPRKATQTVQKFR